MAEVGRTASSDLNAAESCRQHKPCRKSLYHYRKVLSECSTRLAVGQFIQVQAKPAAAMVLLDYRKARLQLPTGIDPVWVADLMKALS